MLVFFHPLLLWLVCKFLLITGEDGNYQDRGDYGNSRGGRGYGNYQALGDYGNYQGGGEHGNYQGGMVLHKGEIAEMRTGEGKTLVAILPAYLNALTGKGVHIVTVNDYLARRDCEWVGQVARFLGLTVGLIQRRRWSDSGIWEQNTNWVPLITRFCCLVGKISCCIYSLFSSLKAGSGPATSFFKKSKEDLQSFIVDKKLLPGMPKSKELEVMSGVKQGIGIMGMNVNVVGGACNGVSNPVAAI